MNVRSVRRVLIAPDKFKGSLSARAVAEVLAEALGELAPHVRTVCAPLADGGEGAVEVALTNGYAPVDAQVTGPLGAPVSARYAVAGDTAVIEMSAASGLALLPSGATPRTAAITSTRGVGELIRHALDRPVRRVVLGIGGSCSVDGGSGLVRALGARVLDAAGDEIAEGGAALRDAATLDLSGLDARLARMDLVVACDVDNPLLGPSGAACVYGPQKGADPATVDVLEAGLGRWAEVVRAATGADRRHEAGLGAGGGTAFSAVAVLGGITRRGFDVFAYLGRLPEELARADLLVVGEGCLDAQSLHGKGPIGAALLATRLGLPAVAIVGHNRLTPGEARGAGLHQVYALTDMEPDPEVCIRDARNLLRGAAQRLSAEWLTDLAAEPITMTPQEWREAMLSTVCPVERSAEVDRTRHGSE